MGQCNSPGIFQEKMIELIAGLESCRVYIDDLLIIIRGNYDQHLEHLEQALTQLSEAGLKTNASKSAFYSTELEYISTGLLVKE